MEKPTLLFILAAIIAAFLLPGDAQALPPDTSARSIGTRAAYSTGTVAISADGYTITLTGGAFATNWGWGDKIIIQGPETDYVRRWISATQLLLQTHSLLGGQSGKTYTISRSYASFSAWSIAEPQDLVANNRVAVGVCYSDGAEDNTNLWNFTGWTTDISHYVWVYVPPSERHGGRVGQGYRLAPGTTAISINLHHVRIEGIAYKSTGGGSGLNIVTTSPAATSAVGV